jgi:hypothetical protein
MRRLRKFKQLPAADRRLLMQAWLVVWLVRLGLWLLPFQRLHRLLAPIGRAPGSGSAPSQALIGKVVWAVKVSSRYVPAASCLTQALAARRLLAHHGYVTELQIGVARDHCGSFQAHAWLEYEGQVLIGELKDLARYTVLPPLTRERL